MRNKKFYLWSVIILFLILDFLALDDITTGNEPDFTGEYSILFVSIPLIAGCIYYLKRKS